MKTLLRLLLAAMLCAALGGMSPARAFLGLGGKYAAVKEQGGMVRIPLADVSDGKAHFYSFAAGGKQVNFFILKSSDGVVRAAFDACDVCFHAKKGYSQDGDAMVCNNCGMRFRSTRINDVSGGCNPAPVARTLEGDMLVIPAAELAAGAKFF